MADIKTIGVVGAGQMGNGIAHVCALAGYDVILTDVSGD
ncbi:MAG: 3-hydroxybutyryl-CoA dehydrogenase, partial [Alphaproteobacteria bacterium]|nr:3-hydroxybutyryl-CoA dehydrogenase [Alphaproteobacteria bacterium]